MKVNSSNQRSRGLARFDVQVAVLLTFLLVTILIAMVLPVNKAARRRAQQINCVENLKEINMAYRVWEGDNLGTYRTWGRENGSLNNAWATAMKTNADTVGLNSGQIVWMNVMRPSSNILSSLKILQCPADHETPTTINSTRLNIRISYFLNLNANEGYPQQIVAGDDNLAISGVPVKPGILDVSSNTVSWASGRHGPVNNISLADGSVMGQSSAGLRIALQYSLSGTPSSTNRIVIP